LNLRSYNLGITGLNAVVRKAAAWLGMLLVLSFTVRRCRSTLSNPR